MEAGEKPNFFPPGCAPEKSNCENYSYPSDVWMLAMTFCCMLNLEYPFRFKYRDEYAIIMQKKEVKHDSPPEEYGPIISELISKMLLWKPEDRATMSQVVFDL